MNRPKQVTLLGVAALVAFVVAGCTASPTPTKSAALPGEAVPLMSDINHIPTRFSSHEPYNSIPPTSGPHVAQTVAPGIYREEIPEEIQVQALQHGHVLVQYAPLLPADQIRKVETIARHYSRDVIVAPYSKLTGGVALTAWGRIMRLDQADSGRIENFIESMRGRYDGWTQ